MKKGVALAYVTQEIKMSYGQKSQEVGYVCRALQILHSFFTTTLL